MRIIGSIVTALMILGLAAFSVGHRSATEWWLTAGDGLQSDCRSCCAVSSGQSGQPGRSNRCGYRPDG